MISPGGACSTFYLLRGYLQQLRARKMTRVLLPTAAPRYAITPRSVTAAFVETRSLKRASSITSVWSDDTTWLQNEWDRGVSRDRIDCRLGGDDEALVRFNLAQTLEAEGYRNFGLQLFE